MPSTSDEMPTLRAVIQRFEVSGDTLDQLRERLASLDLAREQQAEAAASIRSLAEETSEQTAALSETTSTVTEALTQVRAALELAASFLEGTDLSALRAQVESLSTELQSQRSDLDELLRSQGERQEASTNLLIETVASLAAKVDELSATTITSAQQAAAEAATAKERLSSTDAELADLKAKVGAVPERARRKAGLG